MAEKANDPLAVVDLAIEREKGGHRFYSESAAITQATDGQRMFKWLAQEELGHLKHLEEVRRSLLQTGKLPQAKPGQSSAISEPLHKKDFPWSKEAIGEAKPDTKELEALRLGIKAEKEDIVSTPKPPPRLLTPAPGRCLTGWWLWSRVIRSFWKRNTSGCASPRAISRYTVSRFQGEAKGGIVARKADKKGQLGNER